MPTIKEDMIIFDNNWDSPLGFAFRNLYNALNKIIVIPPITNTISAFMFGDITPEVAFTNILRTLVNYDIIQYKNQFKHTYKANGNEYKHITSLLNKCKNLININ